MRSWQFILLIQFLTDVAIILDLSLVRQVIGFIYLTFIPGLALVKLFRLDKSDLAQTLLFSIGFSTSSVMFLGLLLNELFPLFGVASPLSAWSLMMVMNALVFGCCLLQYLREKDLSASIAIPKWSPKILPFAFLPLLSVIGAIVVNNGGSIFLFLIVIISFLSLVYVSLGKSLSGYNSLILFLVALSLLLQHSLITNYIIGHDIHEEFFVFKLTDQSLHWNSWAPSANMNIGKTNAMLSVTILPTVYSQILHVGGDLIFKFLFPFILSWIVIGLYKLYCTQFDRQISFLSVLFFTLNSVFFMLFSTRQMVAELFFVLLFFVLFDKNLEPSKRLLCYLIFGAALVVSHYSMAYIFLFSVLFIYFFELLFARKANIIKLSYIVFFSVLSFAWYVYVSAASSFNAILDTLNFIYRNLYRDFFNPEARGTLVVSALGGSETYSIWHQIGRIFFYISEFLIVVGFIMLLLNRKNEKWLRREFTVLAFLNLGILFMCIILPNFAASMQVTRIYEIALLILAPLCVIGSKAILTFLRKGRVKQYYASFFLILFLIPFFLFQTGFVYTLTNDINWSIPLSIRNGEFENLELYDSIVNEREVLGAMWLNENVFANSSTRKTVYADFIACAHVLTSYGMLIPEEMEILSNATTPDAISYIYLRRLNIVNGIVEGNYLLNITDFSAQLNGSNRIYSNGNCDIYVTSPD